jgi:Raf kinase inhibitor-like YbhB/YbcL family protein
VSVAAAWLALIVVPKGGVAMSFTVRSDSFEAGGEIAAVHTCDGADISPHLAWQGAPEGTRSVALIVDDPDAPDPKAPRMTWVHWIIYNLPPSFELVRGVGEAGLPADTRQGLNDWKRPGYGGPCPPVGRHRYFFKFFALDIVLPELDHPTRGRLEAAMDGHILGSAEIIGTYERGD